MQWPAMARNKPQWPAMARNSPQWPAITRNKNTITYILHSMNKRYFL